MMSSQALTKMAGTLTKDQAAELYGSGWWSGLPARDVALAQLRQERLCMSMGVFIKIIEEATGRAMVDTEIRSWQRLVREIERRHGCHEHPGDSHE